MDSGCSTSTGGVEQSTDGGAHQEQAPTEGAPFTIEQWAVAGAPLPRLPQYQLPWKPCSPEPSIEPDAAVPCQAAAAGPIRSASLLVQLNAASQPTPRMLPLFLDNGLLLREQSSGRSCDASGWKRKRNA